MMNPSMLPMGFTFCPTDEELLGFYLYHKVVGDFIPPFVLPVIDIYTQEPLQIWQQCGGVDGQDVHFFTNLKKKKSRVIRKVGSNGATWSGENKATKVFSSFDNNTLIGSFKRFHYEDRKGKKGDHDHDNNYSWIMYEYTLHPTVLPKEVIHDTFVLCMLRKKNLTKEKRPLSTTRQTSFCPIWPNTTTQLEVQEDNPNPKRMRVEEQPQLLESDLQPLITDYSVEMELKNQQHPDDVGLVNECPIMQINPPHGDQYYDPVNTVMWSEDIRMKLHEICPTMEMKAPEQNYSIEDEDTLFVKEIETELEQQCNDVVPSDKENDFKSIRVEEQPQLLESDLQPLITDYSVEMELKNQQHPDDVGLVNGCPIMQINPPHGDQYYDPVNTVMWSEDIIMKLHEICPTMEMKAPDQNYSIEDEDTLFVKEIETELEQQCNDVVPSDKENDFNYDNEWY